MKKPFVVSFILIFYCCAASAAEPDGGAGESLWARWVPRFLRSEADSAHELSPEHALKSRLAFGLLGDWSLYEPATMIVNESEYFLRLLYNRRPAIDELQALTLRRVPVGLMDEAFTEYDHVLDELVLQDMRASRVDGFSAHAAVFVSDRTDEDKDAIYGWLNEKGILRAEKDDDIMGSAGRAVKAARG